MKMEITPILALPTPSRNSFKAGADKTTVQIVKKMASLAELEQFIAHGYYEQGMTLVMQSPDEYLLTLVANK